MTKNQTRFGERGSMKSNNKAGKRLATFLIVALLVMGGSWIWWQDAAAAVDEKDNEPIMFVVARGEGVRSVVSRLSQNRLIRSPSGFYLLVKLMGIERDIQAGDFRLFRNMDARTIARELTHGMVDTWVTIPEGWRVEEIATKLAKDLDIPEQEFLKYAREGYMFPDTYLLPKDASASAIADILLANFETKIPLSLRQEADRLDLTFDEILTLASIVEREGKSDADRPVIAGILLKRLKASWPLQVDATLQYALGYQPIEKTWWKTHLNTGDKKVVSRYNTYVSTGLPPAPIANPGLSAIKSVLFPQDTDFWYYIHDESGTAHFARTLEEHEANIDAHLK